MAESMAKLVAKLMARRAILCTNTRLRKPSLMEQLVETINSETVRAPAAHRFWHFRPGMTIVGFTFVLQFVSMGAAYYAFGVYLKYLPDVLDTDRFYVSLAMTAQSLVMGLAGPLVGRALAERSLVGLLLVGCALMSVGFWLLSLASQLWHLYVAFGLFVSTGMVLLGSLPANTLVANWFVKNRGIALGISQFGLTISGAVIVPLTAWLVLQEGLVFTFRAYAIGIPILLLPLILKFAIKTPEEVGEHPDGIAPVADSQPDPTDQGQNPWTVRRALADRNIWLLAFIVGPSFLSIGAVLITLPSYGTDIGLSGMQAAGVVSWATLLGAFAKPLFGALADRFSTKLVVACSLSLQVTGICLLLVAQSYFTLVLSGLFFGLGYGGMATLWAVMIGELFGRLSFSRVMGAMSPMIMPFNIVGLPFANLIFEWTGSYVPAYAALLVGFVVAFAALWRLPVDRQSAST